MNEIKALSNDTDPLIQIATSNEPGVLVAWDKQSSGKIGFYQVGRSTSGINGRYVPIAILNSYTNMFQDQQGNPTCYYQITEINVDGSTAVVHNPIPGIELLIKASLIYQVKDYLRLPVYDEEAIFSADRTKCRFTFGNWNPYPRRPEIRISVAQVNGNTSAYQTMSETEYIYSTQLDSNNNPANNYPKGLKYEVDYQGNCYFFDNTGAPVSVSEADIVFASYNVALFTNSEMNQALYFALQEINSRPGTNKVQQVSAAPYWYDAALICGGAYWLLRQLLVSLTTREKRLLLQDPDSGAYDAIKALNDTIKLYADDWKEFKQYIPIARYPQTVAIVTPEYIMPGGRSRFFRMMWSNHQGY